MVEAAGNGGFFILEMPSQRGIGDFRNCPASLPTVFKSKSTSSAWSEPLLPFVKDADPIGDYCEDIPQSIKGLIARKWSRDVAMTKMEP